MKGFGLMVVVLLLLLLGVAPSQACSAHGCGADSYCSGPTVQGSFCLAIEEGGVRTCGMYSCSGGGGGGEHEWPVTYTLPTPEGAAPRPIDRFKTMTLQQAMAACASTPGCTMTSGDEVLMRKAPTWGALKIRYR